MGIIDILSLVALVCNKLMIILHSKIIFGHAGSIYDVLNDVFDMEYKTNNYPSIWLKKSHY